MQWICFPHWPRHRYCNQMKKKQIEFCWRINFLQQMLMQIRPHCCGYWVHQCAISTFHNPYPIIEEDPWMTLCFNKNVQIVTSRKRKTPPKKKKNKKNPHILRDEIYFANPSVHSIIRLSLNLNGMDVLDSLKWGMTKSLSDSSRFIGDFFQLIDFREDNNVCG